MQLSLFLVIALVTSQLTSVPAVTLGPAQEKILVAMRDKFQCCFENERKGPNQKQYAVVYWATDTESEVKKIDFDRCQKQRPWKNGIFFLKPDYTFQPDEALNVGCGFDAGQVRQPNKHTEKVVLWSFRKEGSNKNIYNRCPNPPDKANGDVYMFTYFSPCTPKDPNDADKDEKSCTSTIRTFAKQCKEHFKNFYIGYVEDYNHTAEQSEKVVNALDNAAMKKIGVKPMDCKNSKDCKRTRNEL